MVIAIGGSHVNRESELVKLPGNQAILSEYCFEAVRNQLVKAGP